MAPYVGLDGVVSVHLAVVVLTKPVAVIVHPHPLQYQTGILIGTVWVVIYAVAVVGLAWFPIGGSRETASSSGVLARDYVIIRACATNDEIAANVWSSVTRAAPSSAGAASTSDCLRSVSAGPIR